MLQDVMLCSLVEVRSNVLPPSSDSKSKLRKQARMLASLGYCSILKMEAALSSKCR
jgi:hypothetical protein